MLNRLSLLQKFLILGLIALAMLALPTALHLRQAYAEINSAQQEARGMAPLMAMQKVIQFAQQHRGLSSGMLSGNAAMKERRPGVKAQVDQAIAAVDEQLARARAPESLLAEWTQRKQGWQSLEKAVADGQLTAAQSTQQHTRLIKTLLQLNDVAMDEFGLSMDPEATTHELIQAAFVHGPWLTEKLGIMRAMGSGFLTQANLPPQGRGTLMSLRDGADEQQEDMVGHAVQAGKTGRPVP